MSSGDDDQISLSDGMLSDYDSDDMKMINDIKTAGNDTTNNNLKNDNEVNSFKRRKKIKRKFDCNDNEYIHIKSKRYYPTSPNRNDHYKNISDVRYVNQRYPHSENINYSRNYVCRVPLKREYRSYYDDVDNKYRFSKFSPEFVNRRNFYTKNYQNLSENDYHSTDYEYRYRDFDIDQDVSPQRYNSEYDSPIMLESKPRKFQYSDRLNFFKNTISSEHNLINNGISQFVTTAKTLAENIAPMVNDRIEQLLLDMLIGEDFNELIDTILKLTQKGFQLSIFLVEKIVSNNKTPLFLLLFLYDKHMHVDVVPRMLHELINRKDIKYDKLIVRIFYDYQLIFKNMSDSVVPKLFNIFRRQLVLEAILDFVHLRISSNTLTLKIVFDSIFFLRDNMYRVASLISLTYNWCLTTKSKIFLKTHTFEDIVNCFIQHPNFNETFYVHSFANLLKMIRNIDHHFSFQLLDRIFAVDIDLIHSRFILETILVCFANKDTSITTVLTSSSNGPFAQCIAQHFQICCLSDNPVAASKLFHAVIHIDHKLIDADIMNLWIENCDHNKVSKCNLEEAKRIAHRLKFFQRKTLSSDVM